MTRAMKAKRQMALMRSALGLSRIELLALRRLIVECNGVRGVLPRAAALHVARLDGLLSSIDVALGQKVAAGVCRVCRCTDDHACEGGCWWVTPDLCSACAVPLIAAGQVHRPKQPGTRRRRARPGALPPEPIGAVILDPGGGP